MVNASPSVRQAGNIRGLLLFSGICRRSVSRGGAHVKYRCRCRVTPFILVRIRRFSGSFTDPFPDIAVFFNEPVKG
jgi:hypothetical protein